MFSDDVFGYVEAIGGAMHRIQRSSPPDIFVELVDGAKEELFSWLRRPLAARRQRRAPIREGIFISTQLRGLIGKEFSGLCAYCESDAANFVEHFRPIYDPLEVLSRDHKDHYAWLAYEWANLFLACSACGKSKGRWFPVSGQRARFLATLDEVRKYERPLLIDPTKEEPSRHLEFLLSGNCAPRSKKGRATVEVLQLNRPDLVDKRRKVIVETIDRWRQILHSSQPPDVREFLSAHPYPTARRDVIRRSINEFRLAPSALGDANLEHNLERLLATADDETRMRMEAAPHLLEDIDRNREAKPADKASQSHPRIQVGNVLAQNKFEPDFAFAKFEINTLNIENFKAIDHLSLSLSERRERRSGAPCLMLLGENAVGKSSCLAAFALSLIGAREARRLNISYADLARSNIQQGWDQWSKKPITVRLSFHFTKQTAEFYFDPVRGVMDGTPDQSAIVLGYGPHRYFAPTKVTRGPAARDRVVSLFNPRRPLSDPSEWLGSLSDREFDSVARTIRNVLPIGDDDDLIKRPDGIYVLAQGQQTPIHRLSEGYQSVFAMVADISRELLSHWYNLEDAQAIVLIDEIETHLHPRWKLRVMSSLRRALPKVQFIVTSHDPLCLRGMDDGEVAVLSRDDEGRIHSLEDLPSVTGMRAEQLLTSEYFGLASTVDPDVQIEIADLAADAAKDMTQIIGADTANLITRLSIGNVATEQVIYEALRRYLLERERPVGSLSLSARSDAVNAILNALRDKNA